MRRIPEGGFDVDQRIKDPDLTERRPRVQLRRQRKQRVGFLVVPTFGMTRTQYAPEKLGMWENACTISRDKDKGDVTDRTKD